jgi:hypothetical protein
MPRFGTTSHYLCKKNNIMKTNIIRFTWQCAPHEDKKCCLQATPGKSISVDWGDGQAGSYVGEAEKITLPHTYSKGGLLTVTVVPKEPDCLFTQLHVNSTNVTALDVGKCTALAKLSCAHNQLSTLNLSHCTALSMLSCHDNKLTTLNVSHNSALLGLNCAGNQLSALDVSRNAALILLVCGNNRLTALDVSRNVALQLLACVNNRLTALDVSHNAALKMLYCWSNKLTALDVSHNAELIELEYDKDVVELKKE